MKNRKYLIAISWVLGIFFAASCKKDLAPVVSDKTAKLTFFNTSYELNALLTGNQSFIPIFWDTVDSSFNWGLHYGYSSPPQFNRTNWNLQFPNYNMGDYAQPGQAYWANTPGAHTMTVADTAKQKLFDIDLTTSEAVPQSLFITDSLGLFRSVLLPDDKPVAVGTTNLRFLNLCPDAGNVFITIDSTTVSGLSEPVDFTGYHNFTPMPLNRQDTLAIRLYKETDTATVVARVYATVYPGHAYTVFFSGYTMSQQYTSAAGTVRKTNPVPLLNVINTK